MNSYSLGSAVLVSALFKDANNIPVNPTTITLKVRDPTSVETDYTTGFTNQGVGMYTYVFVPTVSGVWRYRWIGTGAATAASEGKFEIKPSDFTL